MHLDKIANYVDIIICIDMDKITNCVDIIMCTWAQLLIMWTYVHIDKVTNMWTELCAHGHNY